MIETMKPSVYSQEYQNLRDWLKSKRNEKGITLRDVAIKLGRHHSIFGKLEQDRRRIDVVELVIYCQAIGADPHEAIDILINSLSEK
jgi:transcriptional regulator with XRE-family HTH domain